MKKEKKMKDGTIAYLTSSERYYCRREPQNDEYDTIEYYTLDGKYIPLAKAECGKCGDILQSRMCGDFRRCDCGDSFVDTDRWVPEVHRYGGKAKPIQDKRIRIKFGEYNKIIQKILDSDLPIEEKLTKALNKCGKYTIIEMK